MDVETPPAVEGLTRRLVRNLAMQSGSQIVTLVLSVISVWVLTRELSVPAYGGFNYMLAVIYMGLTVADPGVNSILVRELAQAPQRTEALVQSTLSLRLLLATSAMVAVWLFALLTLDGEVRWAVIVFSLVLPLQAAMTVPHAVLEARVLIRRTVMPGLSNRVTGFVCMLIAVYAGYGLVGAAAGLIVGEVVGLTAVLWVTREFVRPIPRIDTSAWRLILRASLVVGAVNILGALVNRLDYFMLERMANMAEVGQYGAGYRLPNLLERLPLLVMGTLYPLMSRLAAQDPVELRHLYHWTLVRASCVAVPLVGLVVYAAPEIIAVWNGPEYAAAVTPLRWLIVSTGCMYLSVVASNLLIALGRVHGSLGAWMVAAPANAVMNWWAIPQYGATGAAAATAVSFAIAMVISLWMAERQLTRAIRPTLDAAG